MTELYVSEAVIESICAQAIALQAHYERERGEHYRLDDLKRALCDWLGLCLEELADEALYHCAEGDRSLAFNRVCWEQRLEKLQPAYTPQEADAA